MTLSGVKHLNGTERQADHRRSQPEQGLLHHRRPAGSDLGGHQGQEAEQDQDEEKRPLPVPQEPDQGPSRFRGHAAEDRAGLAAAKVPPPVGTAE